MPPSFRRRGGGITANIVSRIGPFVFPDDVILQTADRINSARRIP